MFDGIEWRGSSEEHPGVVFGWSKVVGVGHGNNESVAFWFLTMDEIELNDDDVVSVPKILNPSAIPMCKVSELIQGFQRIKTQEMTLGNWFSFGIDCELLKTDGGGWQKGKLRFRLEFIPEEPKQDSPEG